MPKEFFTRTVPFILAFLLLTACQAPQVQQANLTVSVTADGSTHHVSLPAGSTVQDALKAQGLTLSQTDRTTPPTYTVLSNGASIVVTRVGEEFETQQVVIPFDHQELRNESLPAGETRLVQAGQNGLKETTIRHVYENGVETSSSIVSETILQAAVPEIVMVGVQSPFAPVSIPGKLAYLTGGNAWLIEDSTSSRRPLVTSGDLDGNIFSLSPDGKWLLFTRKSTLPAAQQINTLWVVSTSGQAPTPIDLHITNVVHFADWQPGKLYTIAYSTVEPRATAPGWQANNDLFLLAFDGFRPGATFKVMDASSGGIYGWWGTTFAWSPDGKRLAYSRPDGIGEVDLKTGAMNPILNITPLNTHSDWAWTPGLAWGADSQAIYLVTHAPPTGLISPEESPFFDLTGLSLASGANADLVQQTGMFAYPSVSPEVGSAAATSYLIAYLQATFPVQSETSRYRLMVMDQDGANQKVLFPAEGETGLDPQTPVWAPTPLPDGGNFIAVTYQGNLWLIDVVSGQAQQVTGDGLTSQISWR
ncbi:MAG: G5 domain-containing protein [Anaerolineales bacterium]|jgi:hypothetical protein